MRHAAARSCSATRRDAMWIGTFHATCARLLRRYGEAVGLTTSFVIFDDDDQMKLIEQLLKETGLDEQVSPRTILSRIDRAKNRGVDPRSDQDRRVRRRRSSGSIRCTRRSSRKENAVDFNDLLLKVHRRCSTRRGRARACATQFRHVLVDEFQDTNRVQYDLVRRFAEATRNLTVVGDDDQSIYAWRGAEPRNLLDFDRDFPDAHGRQARAELPLDADDPRRRERRSSARTAIATTRRCGPITAAASRSRCTRPATSAARRTSWRSRSGGCSTTGRARRATSRSCTGPTRSRACSRSICARRACRRRSSARCRSSSARRSRTSSRTCGCSAIRPRTRRSSASSTCRRAASATPRSIGCARRRARTARGCSMRRGSRRAARSPGSVRGRARSCRRSSS